MHSEAEIYAALYTDEAGDVVGLDEVQLLDPHDERRGVLRDLVRHADEAVALQAAQILTAWADSVGMDVLERFIDGRGHLRGPWAPHRLHGYDNIYDLIAHAVDLSRLNGNTREWVVRMYSKLLTLYGEVEFEGYLKSGLMAVDEPSLLQPTLEAFHRSLASGHVYLASQLLPPIIRWSEETFWLLVRELRGHSSEPDYEFNVVEALAYVGGQRAHAELSRLATEASPAVSAEAQRALQVLPGAVFTGDMPLSAYRAYQISEGGRTTYAIEYDGAEIARIPSIVVSKGQVIVEYEPADGRLRHEFAGELIKRVLLQGLLQEVLGAQAHELPLHLTRKRHDS